MKIVRKELFPVMEFKRASKLTHSQGPESAWRYNQTGQFNLSRAVTHEITISSESIAHRFDPSPDAVHVVVLTLSETHGIPKKPWCKLVRCKGWWYYLLTWSESCDMVMIVEAGERVPMRVDRSDIAHQYGMREGGRCVTYFLKRASRKHSKYIEARARRQKTPVFYPDEGDSAPSRWFGVVVP
jgi:hypothetical protein